MYCLKQDHLTILAEVQLPRNNTAIAYLAEELQSRLASQLNNHRLYNKNAAYYEYHYPISLGCWASLMHYQATESHLDDLIVDPVGFSFFTWASLFSLLTFSFLDIEQVRRPRTCLDDHRLSLSLSSHQPRLGPSRITSSLSGCRAAPNERILRSMTLMTAHRQRKRGRSGI